MTPASMLALFAVGGTAIYLLTKSDSSAGGSGPSSSCSPPTPEPKLPPTPGQYQMMVTIYDAACIGAKADFVTLSKEEADAIKAMIGSSPAHAAPVPAGHVGFGWVFDDHNALYFAVRREGSGIMEAYP